MTTGFLIQAGTAGPTSNDIVPAVQEYVNNMLTDPAELKGLLTALENLSAISTQQPHSKYSNMFAPVLLEWGVNNKQTIALLDSGNLLQFAAISEDLHVILNGKLIPTKIKGKSSNQQTLDILGISEKISIRFPHSDNKIQFQPLVIRALASHLNLGAKFNFEHSLIPQKVLTVKGIKGKYYQIGNTTIRYLDLTLQREK